LTLQSTKAANGDIVPSLSFPPLDGRLEVELVTGYAKPRVVFDRLGVAFLAVAGNPEDLVGESDVVDVLVLEVRLPGVGVLGAEGLAEAFGHPRSPLLGHADAMDGPPLEPGRSVVLGDRLDPAVEDDYLRKNGAVGEALLDDLPGEPPCVCVWLLPSPSATC
jgi:hypothetical protein